MYFKNLSSKYTRERKALIYLLCIMLLSCLLLVNVFYDSVVQFCVCFVVLIIAKNLCESLSSSLLAKIMPPDWELGMFNAGFLITISTTFGGVVGSFMVT